MSITHVYNTCKTQQRTRVGQPSGLNDDVVNGLTSLPQAIESAHQVITHSAAQAAVGQQRNLLPGALQHLT